MKDAVKYQELTRKLELVRALYLRPGSDGERQAAAIAIQRLQNRLQALRTYESAIIRKPNWIIFDRV